MNPGTTLPIMERFMRHVDATGDCWQWTGSLRDNGYGKFHVHTTVRPVPPAVRPHRWLYEQLVTLRSIPRWLDLDHLCRNRGCVNPDHLRMVRRRTNVLAGYGPAAMRHRARLRRAA